MKNDYHFSPAQNKQLAELTDNKYASLWNGVIYGATDSGEYVNWRQAKGATLGNQHWIAVTGVNGNNVIMVDPASNQTDMWSAYEWSKSSQFNYFKAE